MVEKAEAKAWDNDGEMAARDQRWTAWAADKISGARQCWPQFSRARDDRFHMPFAWPRR
jgi:hypothetical protein